MAMPAPSETPGSHVFGSRLQVVPHVLEHPAAMAAKFVMRMTMHLAYPFRSIIR
jgi:hypothetical protein